MHSRWRDCQEWRDMGLTMSTTSNEASKMFDAGVTQYVGWYDDQMIGGIEATLEKMDTADTKFVMGGVLKNGLDLLGTGRTTRLDPEWAREIEGLVKLSRDTDCTVRERKHVDAIKHWADGYITSACDVWEDILVDHPHDILALKFAHDSYFYLGDQYNIRDSIARVLPHWNKGKPLYGYLLGMHSFGLEEMNLYDAAKRTANAALEINCKDAWATHTLCHVNEMTGDQYTGINMLSRTVDNWSTCGMLACHNYWHWCVYYIEEGEYQSALGIFDSQILLRAKNSSAPLDLVDSASLLYRLELEGVDVGGRWKKIYDACSPHFDDHVLVFNDAHYLMACLRINKEEVVNKHINSIKEFVKNTSGGTTHGLTKEIGLPLCEAFVAFDAGDYEKAVDLLYPIRYKIVKIGGSHAQRDVFNLLLLHAAIKSPLAKHHKLVRNLLNERKAAKKDSPMTDRLIAKAMSHHDEEK